MATKSELVDRLMLRFKGVDDVTETDAADWIDESALEHGFSADSVPDDRSKLVLLYAQALGLDRLALQSARLYTYQDDEETVDKSRVAFNYRTLTKDAWQRYSDEQDRLNSAVNFTIATRVDRP